MFAELIRYAERTLRLYHNDNLPQMSCAFILFLKSARKFLFSQLL